MGSINYQALHSPLSLRRAQSINLSINEFEKIGELGESNPGRQGGMRERYSCAMPFLTDTNFAAKMDLTGGGVAAFGLVFGIDLVPAVLEFDLNFWFKKLDQTMRRFRFA